MPCSHVMRESKKAVRHFRFARCPSATAKAWFSQWSVLMHILVYIYGAYRTGGTIQPIKIQNSKIQKSKNPKFPKSKNPKLFTSTESCKQVWNFGFWDVRIFGISGSVAVWIPGHQEVHFRVSWGDIFITYIYITCNIYIYVCACIVI